MWFSGQQACLACVGPQGAMLHWASKQPAKSYSYPQVMFPFTQMKAVRMPSRKKRETNAIVKGPPKKFKDLLRRHQNRRRKFGVLFWALFLSEFCWFGSSFFCHSDDRRRDPSVLDQWVTLRTVKLSPVLVIVLLGWCKQTQLPTLLAPGFLHSGVSTSQVSICLCSFLKPARLSQPTGKAYQNFLWINYSPLFFHLLGFPTHTHVPSHLSDFGETLSCPFR